MPFVVRAHTDKQHQDLFTRRILICRWRSMEICADGPLSHCRTEGGIQLMTAADAVPAAVWFLKPEPTISEGTLMSDVEYSTEVVFLCSACGAAYKAAQKLTDSNQLGHFDCSACTSMVHSWHDVYDYSAWTPIVAKAARRRLPKRLKMTGPRSAPPRWTQQENQQLLEMAKTEMSAAEMARSLKRTPGSIYSRLQRLYRKSRT